MKRILYTINFLTNGGPTRVLENIINELDEKNYEIYILTIIDENDNNIIKKYKKKGINIISFPYSKKLTNVLKHKNDIYATIDGINPDIIHTHGIVTTLLVAYYKNKVKKVTTIHNNIFEDYKFTYGKIKGIIYSFLHIFLLRKFDDVICCSKTSYDILKKYVKHSKYIRNGININYVSKLSRSDIRNQLNISDDAIVFVYGGVINNRKRVCELVKMFNNSLGDNEYLLIIGDGELREEAQNISNSSHIKFLGFKKNIIDYFRASDVYVSNSSSEGFSISVIEALESNLLLLLSDIPSHRECFEIDDNFYIGEVFNDSNFNDKKEKVVEKINEDVNVYQFKEKYLSSKSMANEYKKYY